MPKTFRGVQLARTGTYRASTGTFTLVREDIDNMVDAYNQLKGKIDIPIKLSHDKEQLIPAAGWIENLRRSGDNLMGDYVNVPDEVASMIESGALRKRSIEAARNVVLAGKKWPMALTGLALLGSELPAIDGLEDLSKMFASGQVVGLEDLEAEETIAAAAMDDEDEEDKDDYVGQLRRLIEKIEQTTRGSRGAPRLRQLLKFAEEEVKKNKRVAASQGEQMDIEKLRKLLGMKEDATEEEVEAALAERLTAKEKDDEDGDDGDRSKNDEDVAAALKELSETQKRVIDLENRLANEDATRKVDEAIKAGRFAPATRDSLIKFALSDSEGFDKYVEATPINASFASGESGSSQNEGGLPEVSESELKIAATMGLTKNDLIRQKAEEQGIELPDDFGKEKKD